MRYIVEHGDTTGRGKDVD